MHTCTHIHTHINTHKHVTHIHTYKHTHTHTPQRCMQNPPSQGYMEAHYRPQAWLIQKQEGTTVSGMFSESSEKL